MTVLRSANGARWAVWAAVCGGAYFGVLQLYGVNLGEESATVYLLYRTARGEIPYIDFISGYTPAYFYLHGLLLRWFGEYLSVVRLPLVATHVANVVLLVCIGRRFLSPRWTALPAVAYAALLPVVEVSELSFNVPYPAWYCIASMLAGWLLVAAAQQEERGRRWLLAGVLAGASFSFKPNSGLFQLAFTVTAAVGLCARASHVQKALALLPVVVGVVAVFRHHVLDVAGFVFLVPFLATIVLCTVLRPPGHESAALRTNAPFGSALLTMAGFAAVTMPWLGWYAAQIGLARVWREIFFVGSGYEEYFFLPYDWSWRLLAVGIGLSVLGWWLPRWFKRRAWQRWTPVLLIGASLGVAAYVAAAPKPEGAEQALISAVRKSLFLWIPLAHGLAAWGVVVLARRQWAAARELMLLNLGAQALFWNAYPRSDFFHLAYAAPLSFVVLAKLGQAYVRRWMPVFGPVFRRWFAALVPVGVALVLVACATPQLRVWKEVAAFLAGLPNRLEWWDTDRALVLIRADAPGERQRQFARTARWLLDHGARGKYLLTFPDLDLLGFLVAARHPARIGYFKSGWPGHAVESEVIDHLEQHPPQFIVTEYPPSLFFYDAAGFFFLLKHWVEERYAVQQRIGRFRVWVARESLAGGDDREERSVRVEASPEVERTPVRECQRGAVQSLRGNPNSAAVADWARAWAEFGRDRWDPGCAGLVLRVAGEQGTARVAETLAAAPPVPLSPLYQEWANALWNIALRNLLARWQFGGPEPDALPSAVSQDQCAKLLGRFEVERDPRLRLHLAWWLAAGADVGCIEQALSKASGNASHSGAAALLERGLLLARLPSAGEAWLDLVGEFDQFPAILPPLFLDWARQARTEAARVLVRAMQATDARTRAIAAYLSVPVQDCAPCSLMLRLSESDPAADVRRATEWGARHLDCERRCTSGGHSR